MANVSIKFNNKEFLLSCEDGQEEHLEELLIQINQKFNDLKKKTPESKDWSDERTHQAYKQTDIFNSLNGCKTSYLEYIINSKDSQDFYILDSNGCLAVDFLGKTESLNKYFNLFCKRVGIKESAELVIGNKSKYYRDYTDYYSEELVKIVEDKEEWVLSNFDYKFE